ncbi:uncharacterized protein HMPREF1541_06459 [Cyphellophora europaea CBS 101466]|uniref:Ketoreductase (KR) domain-containing protein n=1 Tax=Cyphellophora europaea (strain CBS 101466) TaxID=1220924 RepID=W2RRU6_CYPE1|nr:uncharacterized protein HMPREF1541_06459 [Cyphellophora europaea CBS 101466]ETN38424.1 hypothetical protein HMPREF1541_06459 [Cyphellophora europaea CBS 101466]
MVTYAEIQASNALINDATPPRVAVVVGGTSGIGKFTVRALVATKSRMRIYLVGRKDAAERSKVFIQELHATNPQAQVVWIEGEISLLADVQRVCLAIKAQEPRVDLLFLSAGYTPFGTRKETAEGIEIAQSLVYYSRVLFVLHLLPLLNRAEAPRVVSVGMGGMESAKIDLDDIDLRAPGNFSGIKAVSQYAAMKTTTLEKLAEENPHVTFVHSWPGWVDTGNVNRGVDANSAWSWFVWLVLRHLITLFSFTDEESAQRHLFQCTSAAYGGRGTPWKGKPGVNTRGTQENGLFLVNYRCDCTPNAKVVRLLRDKAREMVWIHTQEVLQPYL